MVFEAVPILLEAETGKAVASLEARKSGCLAGLLAPKEGSEGFIEIGNDDLQDMAVDGMCVRIESKDFSISNPWSGMHGKYNRKCVRSQAVCSIRTPEIVRLAILAQASEKRA